MVLGSPPIDIITGNSELNHSSPLWDEGQPNGEPNDPDNCMTLSKHNFKITDKTCEYGGKYPLCEIPGFQHFVGTTQSYP